MLKCLVVELDFCSVDNPNSYWILSAELKSIWLYGLQLCSFNKTLIWPVYGELKETLGPRSVQKPLRRLLCLLDITRTVPTALLGTTEGLSLVPVA